MKILSFILMFMYFIKAEELRAIAYRDVKAIVVQSGHTTLGRRSTVPQMRHTGSWWYTDSELPTSMQCQNVGWDGHQFNWKCQTHLEDGIELGEVTVLCEDWNPPAPLATINDVMTAGSCGVEYTLKGHGNRMKTVSAVVAILPVIALVVAIGVMLVYGCNNTETTRSHKRHRQKTPPPPPPPVPVAVPSTSSYGVREAYVDANMAIDGIRLLAWLFGAVSKGSRSSGSGGGSWGSSSGSSSHSSTSYGGTKRR